MKKYYLVLISMITCFSISAQEKECLVNKQVNSSLNINMELVEMFVSNSFDTISACNNIRSIEIFNERINILKSYLKGKNEKYLDKIIRIILNFELLTKINSESDANFIGKYNPTHRDVDKWVEWLEINKDRVCWYEEKDILFFKQENK